MFCHFYHYYKKNNLLLSLEFHLFHRLQLGQYDQRSIQLLVLSLHNIDR